MIDQATKERNRISQKKRRDKERDWLKAQGYTSWERIHTAIMKGELLLLKPTSKYIRDYKKR